MNWIPVCPELYFLTAVLVCLCAATVRRFTTRQWHSAAMAISVAGLGISIAALGFKGIPLGKTYRVDLFSQVFKVMLSLGLFLIVSISRNPETTGSPRRGEFYLLLFSSTLGMMMLVSSVHLLTLYLSLELSSYSLYLLVVLGRKDQMGVEAGLKYFLIGVIASAVMLFGLALLYGTVQSAFLEDMHRVLPGISSRPLVMIGLMLAFSGFFFKLALFPFHFWVPDVYEGAANPVAGYIATASKVAAVGILLRMVSFNGEEIVQLPPILIVLSLVSMTVGNLAAIAQKDLKRLLGYSSIAHAGYALIGILSMNPSGYGAAMFYALGVLIMKFSAFLVVVQAAVDGGNPKISDLAGLHDRSPLLAMVLFLTMFSLAGIPPTIGFTGKFLVFQAAMERGYFALILLAMVNVAISLYYYIRVVHAAYVLESESDSRPLILSPGLKCIALVMSAAMILLGIFPTYLIRLFQAAAGF